MKIEIIAWLGLALCIAGIVAGSVADNWNSIPIILIGVGIVLIIISLVILSRDKAGFWHRRSTQVGTNAIAATSALLIIIGTVNFLAIRYGVTWDLTENQIFTLSRQSQQIVATLPQKLRVLVFDRSPNPEIEALLENYSRYGKNFQFQFIDPEIEIGLARELGVQSLGEIYLEYGDRQQRLPTDMTVGESLSETQLTNAIERIKRDRTATIYFLQGHGEIPLAEAEGDLTQAVASLEAKGYTVKPLNLATSDKIPEDTDLIAVAGATRALFPAEVSTIEQYLKAGGNILLMLPPNTDPGLNPLLQNWGIELDNRLIVDASGAGNILGLGPAAVIIDSYGEHPITSSFDNGISIFPESRPIKAISKEGIDRTPLITTSEQTWAESNLAGAEITFNPQEDLASPLNIAIALTRSEPELSRAVIFGSVAFATNGWFQQQLNGDIFLNSISWLLGEDAESLSIRPREQTNRRLNLTPIQGTIIGWLALRIIPLLGISVAGVLWWKRR